jgi:hypothetical protein
VDLTFSAMLYLSKMPILAVHDEVGSGCALVGCKICYFKEDVLQRSVVVNDICAVPRLRCSTLYGCTAALCRKITDCAFHRLRCSTFYMITPDH